MPVLGREAFLWFYGWRSVVSALLIATNPLLGAPIPVGSWGFEDPQDLLQPTPIGFFRVRLAR